MVKQQFCQNVKKCTVREFLQNKFDKKGDKTVAFGGQTEPSLNHTFL
jgi:hypothetical protein